MSKKVLDKFVEQGLTPVKEEKPFMPQFENLRNGGVNLAKLPENVYSSVMVTYLGSSREWLALAANSSFLIIPYIMGVGGQCTFAMYLHWAIVDKDQYGDLAPHCDGTSGLLRWVALLTFICFVWKSFSETYHMIRWLSYIPLGPQTTALVVQRFLGDTAINFDDETSGSDGLEIADCKTNFILRPVSVVSRCGRAWMLCLCIGVKVVVEVGVLTAGAGAVLRSANNFDLVLNSVAATFLLELDDVAYVVFVPQTIKDSLVSMPAFGEHEGDKTGACFCRLTNLLAVFHPVVVLVCAIALAAALDVGYWCTADAPNTPFIR